MDYPEHPLSMDNTFYTGMYHGFICDTNALKNCDAVFYIFLFRNLHFL